jgi:hypothetical protein
MLIKKGVRAENIPEMNRIFFDNGTAGKHQYAFGGFPLWDKEYTPHFFYFPFCLLSKYPEQMQCFNMHNHAT